MCDDERGTLYLSEENVGIWQFDAEPDAPVDGNLIARVGENGLAADVEGLALYAARDGRGYLIASSQGNSTFKIFARDGDHAFIATIDPKPLIDADGQTPSATSATPTAWPHGPPLRPAVSPRPARRPRR